MKHYHIFDCSSPHNAPTGRCSKGILHREMCRSLSLPAEEYTFPCRYDPKLHPLLQRENERQFCYKLVSADSQAIFVNRLKVYGSCEVICQALKLGQRESIMTSRIFLQTHLPSKVPGPGAADNIPFEGKFIA